MPLTFNLRHIEKKSLRLQGEMTASELELEGVDEVIEMREPFEYDFLVERLASSVYVHGQVRFTLDCHCVRCLKPFQRTLERADWAWDLPLQGEEQVEVINDCVDLTPFVREDILLAFPQHPLCEIECSGLPTAPQKRRQQESGASEEGEVSSAWAELNKLKF